MKDAQQIFAKRLHQARKMRGLSLRTLGKMLDGRLSHNALHKYETGQVMPDSKVVLALADALDQDVDFFFRPPTVELRNLEFRKRSRLGAKEEESIREQALDYFERLLEIRGLLGIADKFENPLARLAIKTCEDVEQAAEYLREIWRLGDDPIPNVREMLESKGILVFEADAPSEFDGFAGHADSHPAIVLARWLDQDLPRKRFTALHEVGHLLLVPSRAAKGLNIEALCNRFAGAMLIPRKPFISEFGGHREHVSLRELISLKARYGISIAAIMHRALDLQLINRGLFQRFCIQLGQNGWHKKEPGEFPGCELSAHFEQMVVRAAVEAVISESKGAALLKEPLESFRKRLAGVA